MARDPLARPRRHRGWGGAVVSLVVPMLASIAASSIMVLMVAAGGAVIATTPDEHIETRVLDSDYQQVIGSDSQKDYVLCTTRAGVMTCKEFELSAAN
jgi:hypothetical protein